MGLKVNLHLFASGQSPSTCSADFSAVPREGEIIEIEGKTWRVDFSPVWKRGYAAFGGPGGLEPHLRLVQIADDAGGFA